MSTLCNNSLKNEGAAPECVLGLRRGLWARGYRPVVVYSYDAKCSSPGKQPSGVAWQTKARSNPPFAVSAPFRSSEANTGILCDGLRAVDIDILDIDLAENVERVAIDLFGSTIVRTRSDSAKRLLLFRSTDGEPKKRSVGAPPFKVEVLGYGQHFTAYGVHPDGANYEWRSDLGPLEVSLSDLPAVSEDEITQFLDAVRSIVGAPEEVSEKPISEKALAAVQPRKEITDAGTRERAAFEKALTEECGAVSSAPKGARNDTLNKAAFNLAQMAASGWGSPTVVRSALMDAARECGLPAGEAVKTIDSGMRGGAANPRAPLQERRQESEILDPSPLLKGRLRVVESGDAPEEDSDDEGDDEGSDGAPLDEDLTRVPGVLGDLIDWIVAVGATGNRRLALATALPIMGTLLGRRMATPTRGGGGLELYIIATMQSGGGKADQIRATSQLMAKLGLAREHYTSGEFGSGRALGAFMASKPLALWLIDEAADYFERIFGIGQHFQEIVSTLKTAWGYGFAPFQTVESLARPSETVHAPSLSVLGFTTPDDLFRVIKTKQVTGGFANRLTIIDAGEKTSQEPTASYRDPPDKLLAQLRDLYQMGRPSRGNMVGHSSKNGDPDPDPVLVPWATSEAEERWRAYDKECEALEKEHGVLGKIYARTSFQAIKMATIRACGERSPVTVEHVEWGYAIARRSADLFLTQLKDRMLDPISAAEFFQKIKAQFTNPTTRGKTLMEQYGGAILPRKFLWENLKHHTGRNTFDFDNAVKAMASNGEVSLENVINQKTKRVTPCIVYRRRIKIAGKDNP